MQTMSFQSASGSNPNIGFAFLLACHVANAIDLYLFASRQWQQTVKIKKIKTL